VIQPCEAPSSPGSKAATSQHKTKRTTSAAEAATTQQDASALISGVAEKTVMATSIEKQHPASLE